MESPDYLYVHQGGALSPSLWDDEDWKEKPDVVNHDVTLGSPHSPFARSSFDGGLFPNDDALSWMEKSCDLASLTELSGVSVQDVAAFDDKINKQTTNAVAKDVGAITPEVLEVDGVEDLLHDYIDPDVYMVKEERRTSIDSCLSECIEDNIFSSTPDHAGKDIAIFDNNQGWDSGIEQMVVQESPPPTPAPSKNRPILPKTNRFQMVHPVQIVSKPQTSKVITVLPVSTQQQLLIKNPVILNAKAVSVKASLPQTPNNVVYAKGNVIEKVKPLVNIPEIVQSTKSGSIQKLAKGVSIDNFLSALRRKENLAPLQALLDESNKLIYSSPIHDSSAINPVTVSPSPRIQSVEVFNEPIVNSPSSQPVDVFSEFIVPSPDGFPTQSIEVFNESIVSSPGSVPTESVDAFSEPIVCSPGDLSPHSIEVFNEPIVSSPGSPSKQPVEVITCESVLGNRKVHLGDSTVDMEDVLVTCHSESVPSPNFEVYDYTDSASSPNECLSHLSEPYLYSSPGSSSSSGYEDCPSLSPSRTKPYSRQSNGPSKVGRRRGSLPVEEKKNRKKVQNKEAAIRYRQKKRDEYDLFVQEENELYEKNKKLRSQQDSLMTEIKYLKGLFLDLYKAKGLIK